MTDKLEIQCGPREKDGKRAVVATRGRRQHVDKFDVLSEYHRRLFRQKIIEQFQLDEDAHEWINQTIIEAAKAEDERPQAVDLATPQLVTLADVTAKPVIWRWPGTMPAGAVVLLFGDPNEGKSQAAISIIARWTTGLSMPPHDLPTGLPPGDALLLSAEDDLERTTLPRLLAAGGDPRRVHHLRDVTPWNSTQPRLVQLPTDVPVIEEIINQHQVGIVVVDVFSAFIAEGLNQNSDSDMRACLSVISAMAERTQATVILLAHMNKKEGTRGMYRAGGSVAIVGAARAAFAVGQNPEDPTERVFAAIKHNLGPRPASLTYRIEPHGDTSRVVWGGQTHLTAADVLKSERASDRGGSGKLETAKGIISDLLAAGARGSNEVLQACLDAGCSERTYHTARKDLCIRSEKTALGGNWLLTMPANGFHHDGF